MAIILDGRKTREIRTEALKEKIASLLNPPLLAIFQVGNREDSTLFISAKKKFAAKIGARERHIALPENITQAELIEEIKKCNEDKEVTGIIVQLPLPLHIDKSAVIDKIDPSKDADGLTSISVKGWVEGREEAIMPGTARGIRELLEQYNISLYGKKVTVIGRSTLVGKPIAAMCVNENATVTVCHSKTANLHEHTVGADVVIVAAGKPGLVGLPHVRAGQVVIDVGITSTVDASGNKKVVGDVDPKVVDVVYAFSPVPGGVGPMTVLGLFENLVDLAFR